MTGIVVEMAVGIVTKNIMNAMKIMVVITNRGVAATLAFLNLFCIMDDPDEQQTTLSQSSKLKAQKINKSAELFR